MAGPERDAKAKRPLWVFAPLALAVLALVGVVLLSIYDRPSLRRAETPPSASSNGYTGYRVSEALHRLGEPRPNWALTAPPSDEAARPALPPRRRASQPSSPASIATTSLVRIPISRGRTPRPG